MSPTIDQNVETESCLLARASCASIAVFRARKEVGLAVLLLLFLRTLSVFFFRSLWVRQSTNYSEQAVTLCRRLVESRRYKLLQFFSNNNLLLLRLLLWWWCLDLEPERDLCFFLLSRLRERDRRLSLLLLWWRLRAVPQVILNVFFCEHFKWP